MTLDSFGLDQPLPSTKEGASQEMDLIFADGTHPYHSTPGQPLRQRSIERVGKLFEIRSHGKIRENQRKTFLTGALE